MINYLYILYGHTAIADREEITADNFDSRDAGGSGSDDYVRSRREDGRSSQATQIRKACVRKREQETLANEASSSRGQDQIGGRDEVMGRLQCIRTKCGHATR